MLLNKTMGSVTDIRVAKYNLDFHTLCSLNLTAFNSKRSEVNIASIVDLPNSRVNFSFSKLDSCSV